MTRSTDSHEELTPLEQEAHRWVRRLASGEATVAEAKALQSWRDDSAAHAAAFSEAKQFWQAFGPAGHSLREDTQRARHSQHLSSPIGRRAMIGGALAASVAGVMIARPPLGLWPSFSELQADYRTGIGEQRRIAVNADVTVQLNSKTSLSVAAGDADLINLIAGEASFGTTRRVRPFTVAAAGGEVTAVNARFDIRLRDDGACVTCLAEAVEVTHRGESVMLAPHQRVTYGDRGLAPVVSIEPVQAAAWQEGLMIFNMTPLAEVIEELNRYRSGRIVLLNSEAGQAPVNGRFRIDRPDEALVQIERAFGVRRRTLPGGLVLLS